VENKRVSKKQWGCLTPYISTGTSHIAKVGPDRRVSVDLGSLCVTKEMNRRGTAKPTAAKSFNKSKCPCLLVFAMVLEQIKMSSEPAGICHGSPMTSDPCSEMDQGQ
jgi:hypothetical protein